MKLASILLALAMPCMLPAAILTAELRGIPHDVGYFVAGSDFLLFTARHSGRFSVDTATGEGELTIRLELTGGAESSIYGGVGAVYEDSIQVRMETGNLETLWERIRAFPDQTYYWGGDHAHMVDVDVTPAGVPFPFERNHQCFELGPIGLGCDPSMPMGMFYRVQGTIAFNYWGWSILQGRTGDVYAWNEDHVFAVSPGPNLEPPNAVPEPSTALLVGACLLAVISWVKR